MKFLILVVVLFSTIGPSFAQTEAEWQEAYLNSVTASVRSLITPKPPEPVTPLPQKPKAPIEQLQDVPVTPNMSGVTQYNPIGNAQLLTNPNTVRLIIQMY